MLLATKSFIPVLRPTVVGRVRLLDALDRALPGRMTLVAAPAGFGKSTLVSHWLQQRVHSGYGWLSLDEEDNEPVRFFSYLQRALAQIRPELGQTMLPLLTMTPFPPPDLLITALINEVAAFTLPAGQTHCLLVLDDYHLITNGLIHEAVSFLIDYGPPHFHLVINSRTDPPLPLSRWRARGELSEIRAADLRFTVDETNTLLNEMMDLTLSATQIHELEQRTEGWAAALQLASLSMRGRTDLAEFIATFGGSHHFVLDYLTDEVLRHLTPVQRKFMVHISFLDRFCAPLCATLLPEVTGADSTQAVTTMQRLLEELDQANLFVIRLDDAREWYRYHHLFAEFLQKRLQDELEPLALQQLYRQAACWFDEQGHDDEAIRYALHSGNEELLTALFDKYVQIAMARSELHKILGWFDAMRRRELALPLHVQLWYGWALLFSGQTTALTGHLAGLEHITTATPTAERLLAGNIAAMRGWLALFGGKYGESLEMAQAALVELPPTEQYIRSIASLNVGYLYQLQGNLRGAIESYRVALTNGEQSGNLITIVFAQTYLANAHRQQGELFRAEQGYRRAIAQATESHQLYSPATGVAYIGLSELLREWYRLDESSALIDRAIELLEASQNHAVLTQALPAKARVQVAQGQITEALATLARCDEIAHANGQVQQPENNKSLRAWIALRFGNADDAYHWAAEQELPELDEMAVDTYRVGLVLGAIWGVESAEQAQRALQLLGTMRAEAQANGFASAVLHITILQAVAAQTIGDHDGALAYLAQALAQAEPQGYIAQFVNTGPPMQQLLQQMAAQGNHRAYVTNLLAQFPTLQMEKVDIDQRHLPQQPLIEPLSERELEVLTLLVEGCSNAEIARRLIITVGTTKRHVSNIYGKLGVGSRTQAIAYTREIGLL